MRPRGWRVEQQEMISLVDSTNKNADSRIKGDGEGRKKKVMTDTVCGKCCKWQAVNVVVVGLQGVIRPYPASVRSGPGSS